MISKRIEVRKDLKSSVLAALIYGEGLKIDSQDSQHIDKSHRTRFINFGFIDDHAHSKFGALCMTETINLAATEMQSNCDLNTRVPEVNKIAHFVISFNQNEPSETVLLDTEISMLTSMGLEDNHAVSFLHNDNGFWHAHIFVSRIEKSRLHRCKTLWHDQINRDRTSREIEFRHNLERDNGMHVLDKYGNVIEIPKSIRNLNRNQNGIADKARLIEKMTGEKSFQSLAIEHRIGDHLATAKTWGELHQIAGNFNCTVRAKGAGFALFNIERTGCIQLSKLGMKGLKEKFGPFEESSVIFNSSNNIQFQRAPLLTSAAPSFKKWIALSQEFRTRKLTTISEQRVEHKRIYTCTCLQHKSELEQIRSNRFGTDRIAAISITQMSQVLELAEIRATFLVERQVLLNQLSTSYPGKTFRDHLTMEANKGNEVALELAREYGQSETTPVLKKREIQQFSITASISGFYVRNVPKILAKFEVERNGTVIYDFGGGRKIIDSSISKKVHLNEHAALDNDTVLTALNFSRAKFGNELTITGSQEFKRLVVEIAAVNKLPVSFTEEWMEQYRTELSASLTAKMNIDKSSVKSLITIYNAEKKQLIGENTQNESRFPNLPKSDFKSISLQPIKRINQISNDVEAELFPSDIANVTCKEWVSLQDKPVKSSAHVRSKSVGYTVAFIAIDGIVVDLGRSLTIFPKQLNLTLHIGDKIQLESDSVLQLTHSQDKGKELL